MAGERLVSPFNKAGRLLAGTVNEVSSYVPNPKDYIFPNKLAQQAIIKQFRHRFGVAGNLLEVDDEKAEERSEQIADCMVEEDLARRNKILELRLMLPEESIGDPQLHITGNKRLTMLKDVLTNKHDIPAVANSHPITPTKTADDPTDSEQVWGTLGHELEHLDKQVNPDPVYRSAAMLAITQEPYARHLFGQQICFEEHHLREDVMVLRWTGDEPRDNLLLPPRIRPPQGLTESHPTVPAQTALEV